MDLLNSIIGNISPSATLKDEGDGNITAYDGEVLARFVNKETGEIWIYGNYGATPLAKSTINFKKALRFIERDSVGFPEDDTIINIW
ncbi:hypothetical protein H1R20_g12060, partial [Candolleomyces eurysporus]